MKKDLHEKVRSFKGLNEIALKGEIVVYGSSYMVDFPFYELANKNCLDTAIYNRSIKDLTISDAPWFLQDCVLELSPSKLFLHFGENEVLSEESFEKYKQLIKQIQTALPYTLIYIIEINSENPTAIELNRKLYDMCDNKNLFFIDFNRKKYTSFSKQFKKLCHYFRTHSLGFCDAFATV